MCVTGAGETQRPAEKTDGLILLLPTGRHSYSQSWWNRPLVLVSRLGSFLFAGVYASQPGPHIPRFISGTEDIKP